jgi:hypothetical protein
MLVRRGEIALDLCAPGSGTRGASWFQNFVILMAEEERGVFPEDCYRSSQEIPGSHYASDYRELRGDGCCGEERGTSHGA